MAQDGLQIRLEGGAALDRTLSKMAITQQSTASKIVYQSLGKAAAATRKQVKNKAPKDSGMLKKSIKSGLRRKAKTPRNVFMAAMFFKFNRGNNNIGSGGWYSIFNVRRHKKNAFGDKGGNDFITPAVKASEPTARKVLGEQLAIKIAAINQAKINKLG